MTALDMLKEYVEDEEKRVREYYGQGFPADSNNRIIFHLLVVNYNDQPLCWKCAPETAIRSTRHEIESGYGLICPKYLCNRCQTRIFLIFVPHKCMFCMEDIIDSNLL